jgi:hypothetical protein
VLNCEWKSTPNMCFGTAGNVPRYDENVTAGEEYGTNTSRVAGTVFAHCF